MNILMTPMLSSVSPGTANLLSYLMLVVVAVFLLSGPTIYYIFSRKGKKVGPAESAGHS